MRLAHRLTGLFLLVAAFTAIPGERALGQESAAAAPAAARLQVIDGPLNVRRLPSLQAPILSTVSLGTVLDVIRHSGDWAEVRLTGGRTGWVATRFTAPAESPPSLGEYEPYLNVDYGYLEVDGNCLGASPVIGGRLFVPLRAINDALGGETTWIDRKAGVLFKDRNLSVSPGSTAAVLNGKEVTFDAAPFIAESRTLVPIRPFSEALGLDVKWDPARRTAILKSGAPVRGTGCSPAAPLKAYLIMDAGTGLVLSEYRPDERMYVASTTKIMTALLAVEHGKLDSYVTVSWNAAVQGGTSAGLRTGERLTVHELLYGAMLPSGNDAATALAEWIAGTEAAFVKLMNQRARELGARSTVFYNASGLDDWVRPLSTARDMGLIARHALQNSEFRGLVGLKEHYMVSSRGSSRLKNSNQFVTTYPGATGVKNGWTEKAGYTLVVSAWRDGAEVIVVLLGAQNRDELYRQAARLMDQGFQLQRQAWMLR
ncbi:MAG TPA: stalk domain-containing protein [Symbiobacteriaceae bacterium]|nr:stalk domain-containing protein [Symbiobacteriaceae bacterium]